MPTVSISVPGGSYDVVIEPGCLASLGERVRAIVPHYQAAIVNDESIEYTFGLASARSMRDAGYDTTIAIMPQGESNKTLGTFRDLCEVMLNARLERGTPFVAVGGGITGDVVGYVAASYLRGVPFINCPTTLLAMVDAAVGGKTGVNVPQGKNLIGAFWQPSLVLMDPQTLTSLPPRELRAGLAECVKHGVIRDPALFDWIEANVDRLIGLDMDALTELLAWNVKIKAAVVEADEREAGVRAHLNFGHTFAHAIEAGTNYTVFKHGEAVSLGMIAATSLAVSMGMCDEQVMRRLRTLLDRLELPTQAPLPSPVALVDIMRLDKKVKGGKVRLVLPTRIGEVVVRDDAGYAAIIDAWGVLKPAI
ncbi:MAG: 3-dehydroquinate synthase [Planctomycetota bacterium]